MVYGIREPTPQQAGIYGRESTRPRGDFFKPMHLKHLIEQHPEPIPYLGLPPGWRFLIDPTRGYEDVWQDEKLLLVDE